MHRSNREIEKASLISFYKNSELFKSLAAKSKQPDSMTLEESLLYAIASDDTHIDYTKLRKYIADSEPVNKVVIKQIISSPQYLITSLPIEIFVEILTYLSLKDLASVRRTSKFCKQASERTIDLTISTNIEKLIFNVPIQQVRDVIDKYRSTRAYAQLCKKHTIAPTKMTYQEMITYTFLCDDITKINSINLKASIDELEEKIIALEAEIEHSQPKSGEWNAEHQRIERMLASLKITLLAIQLNAIKPQIKNIKKCTKIISDEARCSEKQNELSIKLLESNELFKSFSGFNNPQKNIDQPWYFLKNIATQLANEFNKQINRNNGQFFCNLAGVSSIIFTHELDLNLTGYNLENTKFIDFYLGSAILTHTIFRNAELNEVDLYDASFDYNLLEARIQNCAFLHFSYHPHPYTFNLSLKHLKSQLDSLYNLSKTFKKDKPLLDLDLGLVIAKNIVSIWQVNENEDEMPYKIKLKLIRLLKKHKLFNNKKLIDESKKHKLFNTNMKISFSILGKSKKTNTSGNEVISGKEELEIYERHLEHLLETVNKKSTITKSHH